MSGDKEILAFWKSLIDAGVTDHKIETVQIEEAGNTAIMAGKWQAMGKDSQGKAAIFKGSVVKVLSVRATPGRPVCKPGTSPSKERSGGSGNGSAPLPSRPMAPRHVLRHRPSGWWL